MRTWRRRKSTSLEAQGQQLADPQAEAGLGEHHRPVACRQRVSEGANLLDRQRHYAITDVARQLQSDRWRRGDEAV